MAKRANTNILDGGSDLLRTLAATPNRVKMHLVKLDPVLNFASVTGNSLGSVSMDPADFVQSTVSGNRVTTVAAKNINITANSQQYDTGTATSGGASTLTDTSKNFTTNIHSGRALVITGGTGAGQVRTIFSNTNTVLTVSTPWTTQPDATSTYAIRDDLHVVLTDETGSLVLIVTGETTKQVVVIGIAFSVPSWTYTVQAPT